MLKLKELDAKLRERIQRQCQQEDAAKVCQPVVELDGAQPQQRPTQPLARHAPKQARRKKGSPAIHCFIVRYGKRKLDGDNLAFAHKFLRDAIAEHIGIDDGSNQIQWNYDQCVTSGATGTQVLITLL